MKAIIIVSLVLLNIGNCYCGPGASKKKGGVYERLLDKEESKDGDDSRNVVIVKLLTSRRSDIKSSDWTLDKEESTAMKLRFPNEDSADEFMREFNKRNSFTYRFNTLRRLEDAGVNDFLDTNIRANRGDDTTSLLFNGLSIGFLRKQCLPDCTH